MKPLFVILQYLLPQHLLSRITGALAEASLPWLKNLLIERFIRQYRVDMSEALEEDPRNYACFNAFFTRALKPGIRPLDPDHLVCPADGAISQLGEIRDDRIFQAKGQDFSLVELLGGDHEQAAAFRGGSFATIYLSPRDYHRVHMPLAGELTAMTYIPGQLFSVNSTTADHVPRLFARNERAACYFDTEAGPMAVVLVGAMVVAGIETVWAGQVAPRPRHIEHTDYRNRQTVTLAKGEEMGRFKLGSTVVLLFAEGRARWLEIYEKGSRTILGQGLGEIIKSGQ